MTVRPPLNATWDTVPPAARKGLLEWKRRIDENEPNQGLWIVATRGGGSSYVANVAMRKMVYDNGWDWEWLQAKDLITAMRTRWSADEAVRQHPQDYDLWQESDHIQQEFDFFWTKADIVCIDDLHSALDIAFWRRHLQPELEGRVKGGKPTVVATDMVPTSPDFRDIQQVIENLFVVCDARR